MHRPLSQMLAIPASPDSLHDPEELLRRPATPFVEQLVEKERRTCHLPEEQLAECEYSGAAGKR